VVPEIRGLIAFRNRCKDRFGVSWQVIPAGLDLLQQRPEQIQALMHMKKIVIAELEIA